MNVTLQCCATQRKTAERFITPSSSRRLLLGELHAVLRLTAHGRSAVRPARVDPHRSVAHVHTGYSHSYSITLSALTRIDCGISMQSALRFSDWIPARTASPVWPADPRARWLSISCPR